jgi:uncharacterized protein YjbJ (UPF0337 family)
MSESTNDQITGKLHEMKGSVKETVGEITNSPQMEAEGKNEKLAGKVQHKIGEIEQVLGT